MELSGILEQHSGLLSLLLVMFIVALLLRMQKFVADFRKEMGMDEAQSFPYKRQTRLLSPAEKHFLDALSPLVQQNYMIAYKVRLADILAVTARGKEWHKAFSRITQKHLDFVLCEWPSTRPILVIELDDASHDRPDRQKRDAFVNSALRAANLPILHVRAATSYDPKELGEQIAERIGDEITSAR